MSDIKEDLDTIEDELKKENLTDVIDALRAKISVLEMFTSIYDRQPYTSKEHPRKAEMTYDVFEKSRRRRAPIRQTYEVRKQLVCKIIASDIRKETYVLPELANAITRWYYICCDFTL